MLCCLPASFFRLFFTSPASVRGPQNMYGQQADTIQILKMRQTAYATSAGVFNLKGLDMKIDWGSTGC